MMKKTEDAEKVADEIAGVDEENPASKKRSCIKCKIELASDNKLPGSVLLAGKKLPAT